MLRQIIIIYLISINIFSLLLCGIDKYRAIKNKWRIREKNFFILSFLGGSVGVYIGMYFFRHKTLHKRFTIGIPAIVVFQLLLIYVITKLIH